MTVHFKSNFLELRYNIYVQITTYIHILQCFDDVLIRLD